MRPLKAFINLLIGVLIMEVIAPYPSPDYKDPMLMVKEMVNGSFMKALSDDTKSFTYPMKRYQQQEIDILLEKMGKGRLLPEDITLDVQNYNLAKLKELAWLPFYAEAGETRPRPVYRPRDYYNRYEFARIDLEQTVTGLPKMYLSSLYYDSDNAGLFGFETDGDGNKRGVWFYSLKNDQVHKLGNFPDDLKDFYATAIEYVKGAIIIQFEVDYNAHNFTYVSYGLDGKIARIDNMGEGRQSFGDFGDLAIMSSDNSKTFIYDSGFRHRQEIEGNMLAVGELGGGGMASSATPYMFGVRIDNAIYIVKDEGSSYKWRKKNGRWSVKVIKKPVWKYQIKQLWDYSTDNFVNTPIEFLNFNYRRRGLFTPRPKVPYDKNGGKYEYHESGGYGDFVWVRDADNNKAFYHTFDFKKYTKLPTPRETASYSRRVWIKGRSDDIVGLIPFTLFVRTVQGRDKLYTRFRGIALKD